MQERGYISDIVEPKAVGPQNHSPYLCTRPATAARRTWFSTVTLKERGGLGSTPHADPGSRGLCHLALALAGGL